MTWRLAVCAAFVACAAMRLVPAAVADHCPPSGGSGPDFGSGDEDDVVDVGDDACTHTDGPDPDPGPPARYVLDLDGDPPCWQVVGITPSHPRYDSAFEAFQDAYDAGVSIYDDLATWVAEFAATLPFGGPSSDLDVDEVQSVVGRAGIATGHSSSSRGQYTITRRSASPASKIRVWR